MRKKLFSALLAGCMVVAMGSSMVYAEADDTVKVGISMKTLDGAYFTALSTHITEFCEENGWEVTTLNADSDTLKEAENMDTFIMMNLLFLRFLIA